MILTDDASRADELIREHVTFYMTSPNYRNTCSGSASRTTISPTAAATGSVDAIVVWGDEDGSATRVKAHHDAGADHVCIQTLPSGVLDLDALRRLAPALLDL